MTRCVQRVNQPLVQSAGDRGAILLADAHLDGRQYSYLWTEVDDSEGNRIAAVTYQVAQTVAQTAAEGRPSRPYLNLIREAARQRGLPADYTACLDGVEARE